MDIIIQILQKEYDRVEYAMKLGRSIGKENAPEFKQLAEEIGYSVWLTYQTKTTRETLRDAGKE